MFFISTLICQMFIYSNAALASTNLVSYGQAEAEAFDRKQTVKILDWNVHKLDTPDTYRNIQKIAKNSDIMLLQESMMDSFTQNFFNTDTLGFETFGAVSFQLSTESSTGVSTSSRVQALSALPVRSRETEPVLHTPKMILITEYKIKNSSASLLVANIHGLNFVPNWKFEVQLKQLEAELAKHSGPILLAGDFNTHNMPKAILLGQMAKRLQLDYVWMKDDNGLRLHLDHMFVRGLQIRATRLMNEITSSDHLPLWAELEFK